MLFLGYPNGTKVTRDFGVNSNFVFSFAIFITAKVWYIYCKCLYFTKGVINLKKLISLLLVFSFILTGCASLGVGAEELLMAPSLSEDQTRALACVQQSVTDNIKLSYPKEGEHKNPIIFFDLTGDGVEEAIVFYTRQGEVNVNVSVCQKKGSTYRLLFSGEGLGNQVTGVQFSHITHLSYYNMLVSWSAFGSESSYFTLFGFENTKFGELMVKEGKQIMHTDLDGDLFDELVFVSRSESDGTGDLVIYKHSQSATIKKWCSADLEVDMQQFKNIAVQPTADGCRFFIDGTTDGTMATQVLQLQNGSLTLLLPKTHDSVGLIGSTVRGGNVCCADIFGDGVMDIPVSVQNATEGGRYVAFNCFDNTDTFRYKVTTFESEGVALRFAIPSTMAKDISFAVNDNQMTMLNRSGDVLAVFVKLPPDESAATYYSNGYTLLDEKDLYTYVYALSDFGVQSGLSEEIIRSNTSVL